jgi:Fur family ferric uptake transcriptional regulator
MAAEGSKQAQVRAQLDEYLDRHGLKHTRQRDAILETFLASSGHLSSEQLYERVRAVHPEVGAATVYRTLKILVEAGIAIATTFSDGVTVYERVDFHHDHLVCLGCGAIVEFKCEEIEKRQEQIAREHGYRLSRHRHQLYGYCPACQDAGLDTR